MTFIDAWIVWLLSLSQPMMPNQNVEINSAVTAVHPTHQQPQQQQSSSTWSVQAPVVHDPDEICGRGSLRAASQISNGY